jgi:hypothetical protein
MTREFIPHPCPVRATAFSSICLADILNALHTADSPHVVADQLALLAHHIRSGQFLVRATLQRSENPYAVGLVLEIAAHPMVPAHG